MFDLITRDFSNHFDGLMKAFDNDFFEGFNVESPSFEDKGDFFELRIPVEKSVQVSNVKVRVEDTLTQPIVLLLMHSVQRLHKAHMRFKRPYLKRQILKH